MTSPPFRCADAARQCQDPMGGTAAPARVWLLIEYYGGWGVDAFDDSTIDAGVRAQLAAAVTAAGGRILMIRRPGRVDRDRTRVRAWAVADGHHPGAPPTWGTWTADEDLLGALDPLGRVARARRASGHSTAEGPFVEPPAPHPGDQDPAHRQAAHPGANGWRPDTARARNSLLLVCTHGRHDLCCAVRGRPVAAELARRWPEQTWEVSHVGGDRFAANVVVVPDGVYYGGLDAQVATDVVAAHFGPGPLAAYLRGMSGLSPAAQVALIAAHAEHAQAPLGGFVATSTQATGPSTWQVRLRGHGGLPADLVATVEPTLQPARQLTCRADRGSSATVFVVTALRPV